MALASQTTAEHVMDAVEAIVVNGAPTNLTMIAEFLGTTPANATAALEMATELGLVALNGTDYNGVSPLCRFTAIPDQKAAVLRILIESYRPFTVFRERLVATADLNAAAQATRTVCALPAHRDVVKETLISLGTFSRALVPEGGGNYQLDAASLLNALQVIASACKDMTIAEGRIRDQLGPWRRRRWHRIETRSLSRWRMRSSELTIGTVQVLFSRPAMRWSRTSPPWRHEWQ